MAVALTPVTGLVSPITTPVFLPQQQFHFKQDPIMAMQAQRTEGARARAFIRHVVKRGDKPVNLRRILRFIATGDDGTPENRQIYGRMHRSFFKKEGYWKRLLFSNESWLEWSSNATPLGEVVREMNNCARGTSRVRNFGNGLDIARAEEEAAALRKQLKEAKASSAEKSSYACPIGLASGAALSLATASPAPAILGGMACLPHTSAWNVEGGNEFRISDPAELEVELPDSARLDGASMGAVWQSKTNGSNADIRFRTVSAGGGMSSVLRVDPDSAEKKLPSIEENGDSFDICYSKKALSGLFNLFVRRVPRVGLPSEPVHQVNTDTSVDHIRCRMQPLDNGEAVVTWTKESPIKQVFGRFLNVSGIPYGPEKRMSENPGLNYQNSPMGRIRNGFVIAMENFVATTWRIAFNTFWNNGTATGVEISATTNPALTYVSPDVEVKQDNQTAVLVYNVIRSPPESYEVMRREVSGRSLGPEEQLNERSTDRSQVIPKIAVLDGGDEVAAWTNELGNNRFDVDGVVIHSNGTKSGPEFRVSERNATNYRNVLLNSLGRSRFAGLWKGSGNQTGIFARFFNFIPSGASTTATTAIAAATTAVAITAIAATTGAVASTAAVATTAAAAAMTAAAATSAGVSGSSGSASSNSLVWLWGVIGAAAVVCIGTVIGLVYRRRSGEAESSSERLGEGNGSRGSSSRLSRPAGDPPEMPDGDVVVYGDISSAANGASSSTDGSSGGDTPVIYAGLDQFQAENGE